jgi:hypothetical protein
MSSLLKKQITYTDFNGDEQTEEFCFHLSKAELIRMEMETQGEGGLVEQLTKVSESNDGKLIMSTFQDLVMRSYGKRSEDGKRFIKNQQLRDEFESSEAFSEFFMALATDANAAAEFVNGIMPANFEADVARLEASSETSVAQNTEAPAPITQAHADVLSREELTAFLQDGGQILG